MWKVATLCADVRLCGCDLDVVSWELVKRKVRVGVQIWGSEVGGKMGDR